MEGLATKNVIMQKVGGVLVVGGGVAGIQASLDLAESGYRVYLLEKSPAIGGTMSQLDKTFPSNDCAMCILSPKLVECGRHLNIDVITNAELKEVSGEAGRFRAVIEKKPRYIDIDRCTGCGECTSVCPVELPNLFDEGLSQRKAVFRPFAQAYPSAFTIDKKERPPCVTACPAHVNVQGYIALISQGKYKEALDLIKENLPLAGVLGRVCPRPCEAECKRGTVDEPLAIAALKRFVADRAGDELPPDVKTKDDKVAIIGSGPAGLTAAYYLAKEGYQVTVFEALPVAGGMLYVGIPEYRLPKGMLEEEIEGIKKLGVAIRTNTPVGKKLSLADLTEQGYKAVFIAAGAHKSQRLGIPGEESEGVIDGVTFLRNVNLGERIQPKGRVAIIGGGNVAIDAARSVLRLRADQVSILYRRSRAEMPASDEEIESALAEGVDIQHLVAPVEILSQSGTVVGLRCIRMELGPPDASGRCSPMPISGSEFNIDADIVIPAIGQIPDLSFIDDSGLEVNKRGIIVADPLTLATSRPGIFAGGDVQTGPGLAIEAVAAGKRAAISIDRYLRGEDIEAGRTAEETKPATMTELPPKVERKPRVKMPVLNMERRCGGFDEVELGFTEEMAIQEARRCLNCGVCSECMQCVASCEAEAINHLMKTESLEIEVGSVILCPGFDKFEAGVFSNYGYGIFPNVITSMEFERILSASGPFKGQLLRPSDREAPQRIAWLQCVGSRDINIAQNSYCSSVCCTYAIKEAVVAKEHSSVHLETSIFFMDIRTYGKDFERYYERAKEEHGVRFIRSRIHSIRQDDDGGLLIRYASEAGGIEEEKFDLVVLSVGLKPPSAAKDLSERLGLGLNQYGFCQVGEFSPVATSKPGIFAAGAFTGPRDIPETVVEASAAASDVSCLLSTVRHTLTMEKQYPPERDVTGEKPRIGVFICYCGINIGGVVNVPEIKEYARSLPNVVFSDDNLFTCSQDTQQRIKEKIREYNLNRVVVASCTPRTHEPLFQETLREAGLNKHLFEMTNIRDQCSWVHMRQPDKATAKAKDLIRMSVAKARLIEPLKQIPVGVHHAALIIGGGISGMVSALNLAGQGFEVHLVERTSHLGGIANRIHHTLEGLDVQTYLGDLINKVSSEPLINIYKEADILEVSGYVGNFTTKLLLSSEKESREINHGVAIITSGAEVYRPDEYLYGKDSRVFTILELEEEIARGNPRVRLSQNVVIIQCVGSREKERPYCSRICCSDSIKCALKLKEINPGVNVYVLYRDIRTYGFKEQYYQEARAKGILFIRYDLSGKPEVQTVSENGKEALRVSITDPILGERLLIDVDTLALATATIPSPGNEELAKLFKIPLNKDGFFLEAHVKLRPVDFATDGVFVCGLTHSPKLIEESIAQAKAAASRAATILTKEKIEAGGTISTVDKNKCTGCGVCQLVCPFSAIEIDNKEKIAVVNEAVCKGCGACASSCRSGALDIQGFSDSQILSMIKGI